MAEVERAHQDTTDPQEQAALVDDADKVVIIFEGEDAFVSDQEGTRRVPEDAMARSRVLADLKDAPGSSSLPISKRMFVMWLDLVAEGTDCSTWSSDADLCGLAQVLQF